MCTVGPIRMGLDAHSGLSALFYIMTAGEVMVARVSRAMTVQPEVHTMSGLGASYSSERSRSKRHGVFLGSALCF